MGILLSMTGYGRSEVRGSRTAVGVEIRSLNHRFQEVALKLGRGLSIHEPEVRRMVQGRVARGRVDVGVTTRRVQGEASAARVDVALGLTYAREARVLAEAAGVAPTLAVADLLRLPGVVTVEEAEEDESEVGLLLKSAVQEALDELVRMRQTEGAALAGDLLGHLRALEVWVDDVRALVPPALQRIQERGRERVRALLGTPPIDPARLAQEIATWAARSDVAEELARLGSHCRQFRDLIEAGGAVGRQLDFLTQELHREVNTIGSKVDDAELVARVLQGRAVVERIREQVQNVE
jgi:uncharacterized protein (TIGR00255 family)